MPRIAATPDVREAVMDAASRLMEQSGYRKMTMEAIAQEAGIGKATIYGYFTGKEDVALTIIRRHQAELGRAWSEIAERSDTPEHRLAEMLMRMAVHGFDKARRYCKSIDETLAELRSVILRRRYEHNLELARILAHVLRQGCDQGTFACGDDVLGAAQTLITCVSAFSPTNLSPQELGERPELLARADKMT